MNTNPLPSRLARIALIALVRSTAGSLGGCVVGSMVTWWITHR